MDAPKENVNILTYAETASSPQNAFISTVNSIAKHALKSQGWKCHLWQLLFLSVPTNSQWVYGR